MQKIVTLKRPVALRAYRNGDPAETYAVVAKALIGDQVAADRYVVKYALTSNTTRAEELVRHLVAKPSKTFWDVYNVEKQAACPGEPRDETRARAEKAFTADSNLAGVRVTIPATNIDGIAEGGL